MTVDEITIRVVLDHKVVRGEPIIENLGTEDMATYAPSRLVSLGNEPVVPDSLDVWVVYFERTVVRTSLDRVHAEEECMVVDPLFFPVYMHECRHAEIVLHSQNVRRFEVEICRVELVRLLKVADEAEVSGYVGKSRTVRNGRACTRATDPA